jgi:hypothetical protein
MVLGGFSFEGATDAQREAHEAKVRAARIEYARRNGRWTEIENDLVPRGRMHVSASTDRVYMPYLGTIFQTGSATAVSDRAELYFTVDDGGELAFYERQREKWSELVERQARRRR